jgi:hypothetical protein
MSRNYEYVYQPTAPQKDSNTKLCEDELKKKNPFLLQNLPNRMYKLHVLEMKINLFV